MAPKSDTGHGHGRGTRGICVPRKKTQVEKFQWVDEKSDPVSPPSSAHRRDEKKQRPTVHKLSSEVLDPSPAVGSRRDDEVQQQSRRAHQLFSEDLSTRDSSLFILSVETTSDLLPSSPPVASHRLKQTTHSRESSSSSSNGDWAPSTPTRERARPQPQLSIVGSDHTQQPTPFTDASISNSASNLTSTEPSAELRITESEAIRKMSTEGNGYIPPNQHRHMRACMVCSIVKTEQQFRQQGCPNCEAFLELRGNAEAIQDCTSQVFEGLITVSNNKKSWVARWQRIEDYVPGVYACQVEGVLPEDVINAAEEAGVHYIPRDGSVNEALPTDA